MNLIFTTQLKRESTLHGCELSEGNPPCSMGPNVDDFEWSIGMSVDLPSTGDAQVDWYLTWPTVGGPSFMLGQCFVQGASIPDTSAEPARVSRQLFTDPGVHELSFKRTDGPDPAFNMTGFSEIEVMFQRVNEDGTPHHD